MKKIIQLLPPLAILVVSLTLQSCMEEEFISPVQPDGKNAISGPTNILISNIVLLTSLDNTMIERSPNGTITKVYHTPNNYSIYKYDQSGAPDFSRTIVTYFIGELKLGQNTYHYKYGKLSRSERVEYNPYSKEIIFTKQLSYIYDAQGRLERFFMETKPQERTQFHYNLEGNLIRVEEFNQEGALEKTTHFNYLASSPADKYGFYPDVYSISQFVDGIGVFFKKLPYSTTVERANSNNTNSYRRYEYELNSSGYPIKRRSYKTFFGDSQPMETRTYEYGKFQVGQ